MPKTSMATAQTFLSLGIILLLLGHFVSSQAPQKQVDTDRDEADDESNRESPNAANPHVQQKVDSAPQAPHNNVANEETPHKQAQKPKERIFGFKGQKLSEDDSDCAEDIKRLCHEMPKGNNSAILQCLQDKAKEDDVSPECHHMLWEYKRSVTKDPKFEGAAEKFCEDDLKVLPDCNKLPRGQAKLIPCLLEHRQNITKPRCKHMMTKMQVIIFSDYRLIEGFLADCTEDVTKHSCGRLQTDEDEEDVHSQNDVLECLEEHQDDLKQQCQKQIYRLAELSSDDYHLDRPLYYACLDDREKFCAEIPSGEGRVYKCLKKHKFEETMTEECRERLTERQKLEARDVNANYPLMKSCFKFYHQYREQYNCERGQTKHGALASMLLCLEKAIQDEQKVSGQCQTELLDLKQQLMEDYSINLDIVVSCDVEIEKHCGGGKEKEGKTVDCLMKLAEDSEGDVETMRPKCFDAIKDLLSETGAGSDYRIDHTLYTACEPVVQTACKDKGKKEGDMVLSCLMENMYTDNMNPECEEQLLHLEFFISRDFSLDPVLEHACKEDAKAICHANKLDDRDSYPASMILSCLYRNTMSESTVKVSPKCAAHVRRVMHQRAIDVHLMPEVQLSCMKDLGSLCSDKVSKGEEIECLQEKFDELSPACRQAIGNFTEEEGEDYQLDRKLVRACSGMVTKFCEDVVSRGDTEEVLPCLVEHKNDPDMDEKCYAAVEHWQLVFKEIDGIAFTSIAKYIILVEMKDFRFSPEFKKACKRDAQVYCKEAQSKHDLVVCLSGHMRDAVLDEIEHKISAQCRKHVRVEKEEEAENLQFDPMMLVACLHDITTLCSTVKYGQAKVLNCLRKNRDKISKECSKKLFEREQEEMKDPEVDYRLRKTCRKMIRLFCDHVPPQDVFFCLRKHKNSEDMEPNCREIIIRRQIRQSQDAKLDPQLEKNCKLDIPKFCGDVQHGEGKILECLKKKRDRLSEDCESYVGLLIADAAHDYRLDARLTKECGAEVQKFCSDEQPSGVEECLRSHLGSITSKQCRIEVVRLMREGRSDVQADPVLYKACGLDIKRHCSDIPFGHGQVMKCLLEARESDRGRIDKECLLHLNIRMKMWEVAAKVAPPETIGDLAVPVSMSPKVMSPSKSYFVIFATCLALIFVGGLVFRQLSKRIKGLEFLGMSRNGLTQNWEFLGIPRNSKPEEE